MVICGGGADTIRGLAGDDKLAGDAHRGAGRDTVLADKHDVVRSCERIRRR
jgi:hypothetical protein